MIESVHKRGTQNVNVIIRFCLPLSERYFCIYICSMYNTYIYNIYLELLHAYAYIMGILTLLYICTQVHIIKQLITSLNILNEQNHFSVRLDRIKINEEMTTISYELYLFNLWSESQKKTMKYFMHVYQEPFFIHFFST